LFERIFNVASYDVISADNNSLLTMLSAEMTFSHVKFSGFKVWIGLFYCLSRGSNRYDVALFASLVKSNYLNVAD